MKGEKGKVFSCASLRFSAIALLHAFPLYPGEIDMQAGLPVFLQVALCAFSKSKAKKYLAAHVLLTVQKNDAVVVVMVVVCMVAVS